MDGKLDIDIKVIRRHLYLIQAFSGPNLSNKLKQGVDLLIQTSFRFFFNNNLSSKPLIGANQNLLCS